MAEDPLREVIDSVRSRLEAELEAQLSAVAKRQQQAISDTRRQAEVEAEARWSALVHNSRAEAQQELHAAVAAARADVAQRVAAEVTRVRIDADRQLAEQTRRLRADLERSSLHVPASILPALRQIDATATVSAGLTAMVSAASAAVPRTALFIANGSEIDEWDAAGVPAMKRSAAGRGDRSTEMVVRALKAATIVRVSQAVAVPLLLDGTPVGVLYGDAEGDAEDDAADAESWVDALELIARHGVAHIGYLTALRRMQAQDWISRAPAAVHPAVSSGSAGQEETVQSARRYARLLVSEIKLYNEAAVRDAQGRGELQRRLGPEIDRARRLYDERVPSTVPDRAQHFYQELVQTLAGGDASRLG
jgi:hypothetical protein